MKVLLFGNGAREHSIGIALVLSETKPKIYYHGSHRNVGLDELNSTFVTNFNDALEVNCDLVIIGAEKYLELGVADYFRKRGITVFGASKNLAQIETSKVWARNLLDSIDLGRYSPNWRYIFREHVFHSLSDDKVVKANNLQSGKGVFVGGVDFETPSDAMELVKNLQCDKFVIEERLIGEEFSLHTICYNGKLTHLPICKDFKRRFEGDRGANTGGMGCIVWGNENDIPFLDFADIQTAKKINEKVLQKLDETEPYNGVLYGSFMKTAKGIKVIEFNARFGDPEIIGILSCLESSFLELLQGSPPKWFDGTAVVKYLVPPNYPIQKDPIKFNLKFPQMMPIRYASMKNFGQIYETLGSRTLALVVKNENVPEATLALEKCIEALGGVKELDYRKDIGKVSYPVNIREAENTVALIKGAVERTRTYGQDAQFGDFAGIFQLGRKTLVASTDGVGTKSELVIGTYGLHGFEMLGHDLVNHCVNDILCKGAAPLFFLDYIASSKLNSTAVAAFVNGCADACKGVGCMILGGETAEMPRVYTEGSFDFVGTMVGTTNKVINGKKDVKVGDVVIGLPSSGPHTNGYSLIRKLVDNTTDNDILTMLCEPHKSYLDKLVRLDSRKINALCHITGGGFDGNVPRVIPENLTVKWQWDLTFPEPFNWIQRKSGLSDTEMRRVFNCGYGMLIFVNPDYVAEVMGLVGDAKIIGEVEIKK